MLNRTIYELNNTINEKESIINEKTVQLTDVSNLLEIGKKYAQLASLFTTPFIFQD